MVSIFIMEFTMTKKMTKKIKAASILFLFILLLTSCYTHKIILNPDNNSGTMTMEYTLDDDYFQLLSIALDNFGSENDEMIDPTSLIDADLFKKSFKESNEIKLKSINIQTNNNIYKGKIVIEFNNLEKLIEKIPKGIMNFTVKKENGKTTFSQELEYKKMDPDGIFKEFVMKQKEDDINLYNKLTKEAKFKFIIITSKPIKYSEGVILSSDKKTAEYNFKVNDIFDTENKKLKFIISL